MAVIAGICLGTVTVTAQPTAWFVDGFHGGIYGHYPPSFTQYIVDAMKADPDWKLNLEIEPATWDFARTNTPEAYAAFKTLADDQTAGGRIEFINPAYGQSYLWNISGESVIQQLDRGMSKIREHFPKAKFTTYSCQEPCFTSALPGILSSFGFKYAVLKNPNTCWGGYSRAHGGELVNWIGPDGTALLAVPRYAIESLRPGSTWETIGNANSPAYIRAALAAQIEHPVGMCLQDAGWRNGSWLKHVGNYYEPSVSTLWRSYFENVAARSGARDWQFSQEDVQVSLVWGSQVLQRIAQEARRAENSVLMAEKMATLAGVYQNQPWPGVTLDESWRTLMLSQHHDCWIVPYNGHRNHTWADEVAGWTANTCHRSEEVIDQSMGALVGAQTNGDAWCIQVFNTLGHARTNLADVALPEGWSGTGVKITDAAGTVIPAQPEADDSASHEPGNSDGAVGARFVPNRSADVGTGAEPTQTRGLAERCELGQLALRRQARFMAGEQVQKEQGNFQEPERRSPTRLDSVHAPNARLFAAVGAPQELCFRASCPPLGFSTYRLERASPDAHPPLVASVATNGLMTVETDFYKLVFDADHGGTISSLKAKQLGGRELVESGNARRFNEVRGFFFEQGRFFSNADQPAKIELLENGPVRIRVRIIGEIESNAITQMVSLVQGEPRLDFSVRIDWRDNPGIGSDYLQHGKVRPEDDRKAFYDDRYKLQATFPLNLPGQRIFKDAPFDVTESHLTDTFFQNWSAIKNNLILDWVEAYDPKRNSGVALFSDHTTSYTHDTNHTLGLTLQYAGVGLWGRNYPVQGATEIHYALLPHSGDWERAGVWNAAKSWNEPLMARTFRAEANAAAPSQSLLQIEGDGWEVPTARLSEGKVLVRLFNPSTKAATKVMHYNGPVSKVEQVKLGGQVLREITFKKIRNAAVFEVTLPRLGVGTLRFTP